MKHTRTISVPKKAQPLCADALVQPTPGPYMTKLIEILYCIRDPATCDKCEQ